MNNCDSKYILSTRLERNIILIDIDRFANVLLETFIVSKKEILSLVYSYVTII